MWAELQVRYGTGYELAGAWVNGCCFWRFMAGGREYNGACCEFTCLYASLFTCLQVNRGVFSRLHTLQDFFAGIVSAETGHGINIEPIKV